VQVMHIPESLKGWKLNNIDLSGTEEFGDIQNNDSFWLARFSGYEFEKFKTHGI